MEVGRFVLLSLKKKEVVLEVVPKDSPKGPVNWRVPDLVNITIGVTGMGETMATPDNSPPPDTKTISGTDTGNLTEATAPLVKKGTILTILIAFKIL